jgi:hypothetical protein
MRRKNKSVVVLILSLFISATLCTLLFSCPCALAQPVDTSHHCCLSLGDDCSNAKKCSHITYDLAALNQININWYSSCKKIASFYSAANYEIPILSNAICGILPLQSHNLSPSVKLFHLHCSYLI